MSEFETTAVESVKAEDSLPEKLQEIEDKLTDVTWLSEILKKDVNSAQLEDMSTAGLTSWADDPFTHSYSQVDYLELYSVDYE
jgi:hypothetical protein